MKDWTLILLPLWSLVLGIFLVLMFTGSGELTRYPVVSMPQWQFVLPTAPRTNHHAGTPASGRSGQATSVSPFAFESTRTTPVTVKKDLPPLKLTLIAVAGRKKICRINGQRFTEGQKGHGFQVLKIDDTHVEIMFDTDRQLAVLYLHPPEDATHVQ